MAPQLARVCAPYDIVVRSSGGFDSVTEQHRLAEQLSGDLPAEVLHIGDHDPSGAHIFLALEENVRAFADERRGDVSFTRLAVTPAQVGQLNLPTAPPKPGDKRAFAGETCQAEAIAPDILADILRQAIEQRIDHAAYAAVLQREEEARGELIRVLSTL
jgi:hypothetical protein